jgi:carbon-monoxide dehydrogenase medium subunit
MLRRFRLEEPVSVKEASELLGRFGDSAKIYAGGTELLLTMKEGLVHFERLVNLKNIKGLKEIRELDGTITLGALCTHHELEQSPLLKGKLAALAKLEHHVANVRVRQAGTIGGNLCFAEPHADPGILLMALGAKMVAENTKTSREITAQEFFVDAYETALNADEVLTEIRVPVPQQRTGVCYLKFGYLERPSVGVALALTLDGNSQTIGDVRVAVGCAGPAPKRVEEAEAMLRGKSTEEAMQRLSQAGAVAGRAAEAIGDLHGSEEYKEHIIGVLLKRAFQEALKQRRA